MLRGILRNVQYLFLFFSVLLVFLALQKLQYLPQHNSIGIREGAADFDKPDYNELKSSFYYRGGDETKEIGWRSFRVGVFKFILPSFSSPSSASSSSTYSSLSRNRSENNEYYLTVPPPNDRPKSVAYILDLSTRHQAADIVDTNTIANARRLAKSIQRMHSGSKYDFKLYAFSNSKAILPSPANDENGNDRWIRIFKLGFEIIDSKVFREKTDDINSIRGEATTRSNNKLIGSNRHMYKIWKRHDLIISLSGIELHSSWNLDGLFDILLSKNSLRFPGVDSFLLQPHHSYTRGREEILIFNGSSHRAYETCLKFFSCVTADGTVSNGIVKDTEADVNRRCIDQIDSNRGLAMCTYHQDFIDCSESMLTKDAT
eukprot:scaffold39084_cov178-Skeletonema_dohrnii-CCMP3373.AAC.1